jgi:hypothetical protein
VAAGGSPTTATWSHTCTGADRALGVAVSNADTASPTSVTYNGVGLTKVASASVTSTDGNTLSVWASIGFQPASGANNIVVTFAANTFDICAGAMSVTGADQTDCVSAGNSATGTSVSPSVTVTTAADELLFAGIGANHNGTCLPGTNETELFDRADGGGGTPLTVHGYRQLGSDGGVIAPTLSASADWAIGGISFKAVGAGGTIATPGAGSHLWTGLAPFLSLAMANDGRIVIQKA